MKPALFVLPGRFAVCRLPPERALPPEVLALPFWSAARTPDELSLVVPETAAPPAARVEGGWRCLGVRGPIPFSTVGLLAALTTAVAGAGVSLFAFSTYDTDYLLVQESSLPDAVAALADAGFPVEPIPG